jgi:agmatinase
MRPARPRNRRAAVDAQCAAADMTAFAFHSDLRFLRAGADLPRGDAPPAAPARRSAFAVAGIAWDGATTNRPGARFGPRAIREASHMLCDATHPLFDVSPLSPPGRLADLGDLPLPNTSLPAMRAALQPLALELLRRHHMVWLGGDHSVTLPLLRAYREHFGRPIAVIHFDAHCDTWDDHFGEPSGHGTWVREAMAEGLVNDACFTQIGIRSAAERRVREFVRERGGQIFTARELRGLVSAAQLAPVLDAVRQRLAAHGRPPLYLSLDIDCLDPAFAPGTGTPEPGGLSTAQVLTLLEDWADLPFVGMDCVEVAPPYDHAELSSQAAAHFVWTYLCTRLVAAAAA